MQAAPHDAFGDALAHIGEGLHASLTTFRKDGRSVATPVGCVIEGGALYLLTPPHTGKVTRIRNSGHVLIAPCDMRGTVPAGAPRTAGVARLLDADETARVQRLMARRSLMYRAVRGVDRLLGRRRALVAVAVTAA